MFTRHRHDESSTYEPPADEAAHRDETRPATAYDPTHDPTRDRAHERFGGINYGADFFGWLVAVAVIVLLTAITGALVAAVGQQLDLTAVFRREADTVGIVAAAVLVVVSVIGYYAGGYVAGRMSRFDGVRQGLGVWLIGLVVMAIAGVTGALFGREYDVLDRVDLPRLPVTGEEAGIAGLVTLGALLLCTLLAALAGGKIGRSYHDKVDASRR